jgi:hypothetical protein
VLVQALKVDVDAIALSQLKDDKFMVGFAFAPLKMKVGGTERVTGEHQKEKNDVAKAIDAKFI